MRDHITLGEEREYELKCKVKIIEQSYREVADDNRLHSTKAALLLPDLSTSEASRFLTVYLPEVSVICTKCEAAQLPMDAIKCPECGNETLHREHTEVPAWVGNPIHSPCRLALLRKNNYCNQHHLFVMSTGVEEDLKSMDGKTIAVRIMSSLDDEITDAAKTVERTAKRIEF